MNMLGIIWEHIPLELVLPLALWGGSWFKQMFGQAVHDLFAQWTARRAGRRGPLFEHMGSSYRPTLRSYIAWLPELYRWQRKKATAGWTAPLCTALLTVAVVIAYVSFVEDRLEPLREARALLVNKLPYCANDTRAGYCNHLVGNIVSSVFAANQGLSGGFEALLVLGALTVALALLLMPHLVLKKLKAGTLDKAEKTVFLNRAHLATFLELILAPPVVWLLLHRGATVTEGGYSVAEIAAAVLSPLTLDIDQHLRTLGPLTPVAQRSDLFLAVGHIKSALYLIAALSAFILLVVFEIAKNMIIKPVLEQGLNAFRLPKLPPPEDTKKTDGKAERPSGAAVSGAGGHSPSQIIVDAATAPVEQPVIGSTTSGAPAVAHPTQPPGLTGGEVGKEPPAR